MHFYSFNIKDYHLATAHLSLEEDGCYRRILDMYYDTEGHLPSVEMLAKKIRAPKEMVLSILEEFFTELDGGYFNQRADSEIEKYKMMSDGGKKGAEIRWAKTRLKAGDSPPIAPLSPPLTPPNANHYPLPTSHEPSKPFVSHEKIVFDGTSFKNINGRLDVWKSAYPAVDITFELNKIAAWVISNPKNVKKQWGRFINSWLSRAQDKAPRVRDEGELL